MIQTTTILSSMTPPGLQDPLLQSSMFYQAREEHSLTLEEVLLDLIDEEGEFGCWIDPLSEAIRDCLCNLIEEDVSEEAFATQLDNCKEKLKEIFYDSVLETRMTRPVLASPFALVTEEGATVFYQLKEPLVFQEDTLIFYQKYSTHYGHPQTISFQPHLLGRKVIDILSLYPESPPYVPLDLSVDPTSDQADSFMIAMELLSLNLKIQDVDLSVKQKTREGAFLLAQQEKDFKLQCLKEEIAKSSAACEEAYKAEREKFDKKLSDHETTHHQTISSLNEHLSLSSQKIKQARKKLKKIQQEKQEKESAINSLQGRVQEEKNRCKQELNHYARASHDFVIKQRNKIGF